MTMSYSMALKQQMVARLSAANAVSAAELARETGISQQNLSGWLSEARSSPFRTDDDGIVSAWPVEQKARIIVQAAELTGDDLTAYLQSEGVRSAHFSCWRRALGQASAESVGMAKRIGKLERELTRTEKALAKAATLLVLRDTIESQIPKAIDGTDKQVKEERS